MKIRGSGREDGEMVDWDDGLTVGFIDGEMVGVFDGGLTGLMIRWPGVSAMFW